MVLGRRGLLRGGALGAAGLAMPRLGHGAERRVLKFVPQADLAAVDPMWTTSYVTRNHGYMVYDTLYGLDEQYQPQPQMVEFHQIENDGLLWRLTLREGLRFHDNTPVLARDAVASIRRWAKRDPFGQALIAVTAELSAPSDRVIQFKLSRPFPLLPNALGKAPSSMPCIMPERLAQTDAMAQVIDTTGSGPYRFVPAERVAGSQYVYERFDGYVPRPGAGRMSGGATSLAASAPDADCVRHPGLTVRAAPSPFPLTPTMKRTSCGTVAGLSRGFAGAITAAGSASSASGRSLKGSPCLQPFSCPASPRSCTPTNNAHWWRRGTRSRCMDGSTKSPPPFRPMKSALSCCGQLIRWSANRLASGRHAYSIIRDQRQYAGNRRGDGSELRRFAHGRRRLP